jgi:diguanylate cyclase (GGDEF)-like protein
MLRPAIPIDEDARLAALRALEVPDTEPEERFERVTRLAQRLFDAPVALVTFVDADRVWCKSNRGLDAVEWPRDVSFCAHAVAHGAPLTVPDTTVDERYADHPHRTGGVPVRSYAGHPIRAESGHPVGTLCLMGTAPRALDGDELRTLGDLAGIVERELSAGGATTTDHLTGLTNHRGFELLAEQALRVADRNREPATLLSFDLHGLRHLDDAGGRRAGDQAIVELGRVLLGTLRGADLIARVGGDVFCALLGNDRDGSAATARIQAAIAAGNAEADRPFPLRLSVGAAAYEPGSGVPVSELVQRADAARYIDKVLGRAG